MLRSMASFNPIENETVLEEKTIALLSYQYNDDIDGHSRSERCWCDPIVERFENENLLVIHRDNRC